MERSRAVRRECGGTAAGTAPIRPQAGEGPHPRSRGRRARAPAAGHHVEQRGTGARRRRRGARRERRDLQSVRRARRPRAAGRDGITNHALRAVSDNGRRSPAAPGLAAGAGRRARDTEPEQRTVRPPVDAGHRRRPERRQPGRVNGRSRHRQRMAALGRRRSARRVGGRDPRAAVLAHAGRRRVVCAHPRVLDAGAADAVRGPDAAGTDHQDREELPRQLAGARAGHHGLQLRRLPLGNRRAGDRAQQADLLRLRPAAGRRGRRERRTRTALQLPRGESRDNGREDTARKTGACSRPGTASSPPQSPNGGR